MLSFLQEEYNPLAIPIQLPAFTEAVKFGAEMKDKHFFLDVSAMLHHNMIIVYKSGIIV